MYFWNSYPFVRLSITFILGIFIYDASPDFWDHWRLSISLSIPLLGLSIYFSHRTSFYKQRHLNGAISLATVILLGGLITKLQYHSASPDHYKNHLKNRIEGFSGRIVSSINERTNHLRYDLELDQIYFDSISRRTDGKIHIYIKKDTSVKHLNYGDHILVRGYLNKIPAPDNPAEFDYRTYLERQNIHGHSFVSGNHVKIKGNRPPNWIINLAYKLRSRASKIIDENITAKRENSIAQALLLGIKDHLDNDIKKAYSSAGAMHVLAVSGLHVGIIYLLLNSLLGRLKNQGAAGKKVFGILSIGIIWFYALVTGLSPSVMRAATMFSLMAASELSYKEGNIYNTLGLAAFILLIYDPYLIYSVGFQLSFAAVLGIVYLQPKIYRLIHFRWWLLDKSWAITCVSIAAQLSTFPLSAYYFHQFPTYFLVSNLVVIPAAFTMLVGGISMIIISAFSPWLGGLVGDVLYRFMWLVNESITLVEKLPNSLIEWIYLDRVGLLFTYLIVFTGVSGLHFRSFKTLIVSCALGVLFTVWAIHTHYDQSTREQLIFYEISGKTAIDHVSGHSARFYLDHYNAEEIELLSFQVNPFRLSSHLSPISSSIASLSNVFRTKESLTFGEIAGKRIILFDSTTFHLDFHETIETDIILVENGSVKSLDWLQKHFTFEMLVIGNRNSFYYSRKMKKQALKTGIRVHSLKENGALIINL